MPVAGNSAVAASHSSRSARRLGQVAFEREHACQHALDVAVEDGHPLAEAEGGDRRGGRAADAGQRRRAAALRARELAAMLGDIDLRAAMQVARPAVVAQAAPEREHLVLGRRGERADVGEAGDEAIEVAEHGRDLRLLQHHFREPDAIRLARLLPGQVVAPVRGAASRRRARRTPRDGVRGPFNGNGGSPPAHAWRCIADSRSESFPASGTASSKSGMSSATTASVASGAANACSRSASASSLARVWN